MKRNEVDARADACLAKTVDGLGTGDRDAVEMESDRVEVPGVDLVGAGHPRQLHQIAEP